MLNFGLSPPPPNGVINEVIKKLPNSFLIEIGIQIYFKNMIKWNPFYYFIIVDEREKGLAKIFFKRFITIHIFDI